MEKSSLLQLIVDNLQETPSGILLRMAGGWLEEVDTYLVLTFGLMNGLVESLLKSMIMSRKSMHLELHSVVTLRSSC